MIDKVSTPRVVARPIDSRSPLGLAGRDEAIVSSINLAVVFWRRRWIILGCLVLSLLGAFLYLRKAIPLYSSSSTLYVHQSTPRIISDAVVNHETANLFTQCELIKSTANLSGALQMPGVADSNMLRGAENPVGLLKSLLTAEPGKQGDLLNVSMLSPNPVDASVVLNAVVQSYIDYQNRQQKSSASEVLKILEREKDRYERQLKVTTDSMVQFKQDNPEMAMATDRGNIVTERFATLSDALTHAQFQTLDLQLQNDEIAALKGDPAQLLQYMKTIQEQGKGAAPPDQSASIESQIAALQSQERVERRKFGDQASVILDLNKAVSELQQSAAAQQQQSIANFVAVAAFNLKEAKTREEQLTHEVDKVRSAAVTLNAKSAKFDQMVGEERRDERMLDTLDNRIKELNVTEDAGGSGGINVSILESAKPNMNAVSPKPGQTMAIGLIVGIMMGLSGALLQDFMDQRLRSAEEIGRLLELPILGVVPHMNTKAQSPERGQEVHLRTRSDVSEAYRTIRTAIYFGVPEDSGRTILITSPAPGDGKSTMASNLAIAMAQAGRRVLIIDADCRRPTQHKTFNVKAETGLCTVLLGRTAFADAVHHTSTNNLDFLPCGPLPTNPSELLDSQALIDLLRDVSGKYDNVVIDTAPVVPVTDARILSASCDITVLVLRAEKSTRSMTQHAVDALSSVGANILGVVVNDVPRGQDGQYYYYGGYGYKYGYSSNGNSHKTNGTTKEVTAITVASKAVEA